MRKLKEKLNFYIKDLSVITLLICGVFFVLILLSFIAYFIIKQFM